MILLLLHAGASQAQPTVAGRLSAVIAVVPALAAEAILTRSALTADKHICGAAVATRELEIVPA